MNDFSSVQSPIQVEQTRELADRVNRQLGPNLSTAFDRVAIPSEQFRYDPEDYEQISDNELVENQSEKESHNILSIEPLLELPQQQFLQNGQCASGDRESEDMEQVDSEQLAQPTPLLVNKHCATGLLSTGKKIEKLILTTKFKKPRTTK
ncbi:unnamed protein product [Didymodactylos carnosus]|nr:unnamed protein product [Didymodactylos carnosus]CAF4356044.1 unnamed protein product [Didymodactylos carnosus]